MTGARRALVVDDDAGIRILVTRILQRNGFVVESARDGADAIEHLLQFDYDLVALDLMMPRIDGFGVIRYLTDHMPERLATVVVMTAFGSTVLSKVCPPVTRFLEKPFDIEALIARATEDIEKPAE